MTTPPYQEFVQRVIDRHHLAGKDALRVGSNDLDSALRLLALAYSAASYVGVDLDLTPKDERQAAIEDLLAKFGRESFDLVVCSELLQHVEDWRLCIGRLKRLVRPHGSLLITTRSLQIPSPIPPRHPVDVRAAGDAPACVPSGEGRVFREHDLAHALLDGLSGLEIGAAAHNPFGLRTRNVALPEGYDFYAEHQRREMGVEPALVDLWASADRIPVPDASEDFIISSHVVEHLPNLIVAFAEWDRIVRDGGYVFMIVPHKGALPADDPRELTSLAHFIEDCHLRQTLDTHPIAGIPGGRAGHYHTFTPDLLLEIVEWMRVNRFCEWEPVAREDVDRKVGNGFALAFRVRHTRPRADLSKPNWRFELSDMEAIFSDLESQALEADPSEPGVFLFARKPVGFQERDLEGYPLFSVIANRRITGQAGRPPEVTQAQDPYDERYYDTYHSATGVPYRREEPWLSFFTGIAERIVQEIQPRTVLDIGCAKGFLVEALRDRGVEAFGLDISEYAISQIRDDMRPYCWAASVVDPFPTRYDLVVCMEVLEHLPTAQAELAVANLCRYADDVLFSSTPDEFTEPTHLNVQSMDYWAELFAKHSFYRDLDFDASFIADHAVRFRKVTGPLLPVVRAYERRLWKALQETHALRRSTTELGREKRQIDQQLVDAALARQRLDGDLAAAVEQQARLEGDLAKTTTQRDRLEAELAATNAEVGRLGRAVLEREETIGARELTIEEKEARIDGLAADLEEIQSGLGWRLIWRFGRARDRVLPAGSRRREAYDSLIGAVRTWVNGRNSSRSREQSARHATGVKPASMPDAMVTSWGSRVLMVNGSNGDMTRYRCFHTQEQLQPHGLACDVVSLTDTGLPARVPNYDLLILHRVPHSHQVERIVQAARHHGVTALFDIDDLVFDPEVAMSIDALRWMTEGERALFMDGIRRYRRTLGLCDGALVTTGALARASEDIGVPAWVHRNALSLELIKISEDAVRTRTRVTGKVVIGYASGTRTHNRDFCGINAALERVLRTHSQVELWVIGYLDLDGRWAEWGDRVRRVPFVPWQALPNVLAHLDINLAPLEADNRFCKAKSELKYIEAAAVGVPTIASAVEAFEYAICHGENGLLAHSEEEWDEALERLITDPTLRLEMGERARVDALQRYHPSARSHELLATLDDIHRKLRGPASTSKSRSAGQRHTA
ncbi:MAG: methyltransferase domain-containing protein [candidate division NC10 bacterium]|nr:methyltransferase domain-containing protein [candidate division NC10 bacterium]MDE2484676.1 methyltransferase domain-containing protein [candidate division NC10 bacterium]